MTMKCRGRVGSHATRLALAGAAAGLLLGLASPAAGATSNSVAHWEMNEPTGATTMLDSSSNRITGAIGSAVVVTGAGHFTWSKVKPNEPPAKPERLVVIDDARLNPGLREYAVTIRYRTSHSFGNMAQKGQATTAGGQWKVELPQGKVSCLFRGASGKRAVTSLQPYNDGEWHTIRCERNGKGVRLSVYDAAMNLQERRWISGPTGDLANTMPMTIGGKYSCDQITVTCDYFSGDIDFVRVDAS